MVGIAQLVERLVVVQEAAGSSPVTHPIERLVVVQRYREAAGSSPVTHPIERLVVVQGYREAAGSSPVTHPKFLNAVKGPRPSGVATTV